MLTSRQRLQRTLNHQDPGQVVVDLGSTSITGISASALTRLRSSLGLKDTPVRVHEPYQLLGFVDQDVISALGVDVAGIWPSTTMFGYGNENWKPWRLSDGTPVLVGAGFVTSQDTEGNLYLHPKGDLSAPPTGKLPKGGFYFDNLIPKTQVDESHLDGRADFAEQYTVYTDEECRYVEQQSKISMKIHP